MVKMTVLPILDYGDEMSAVHFSSRWCGTLFSNQHTLQRYDGGKRGHTYWTGLSAVLTGPQWRIYGEFWNILAKEKIMNLYFWTPQDVFVREWDIITEMLCHLVSSTPEYLLSVVRIFFGRYSRPDLQNWMSINKLNQADDKNMRYHVSEEIHCIFHIVTT